MTMFYDESMIRARDFAYKSTRVMDGLETDIFSSADGVEIQIAFDEDGITSGLSFHAPAKHEASAVMSEEGHPMTQEEIEVLGYELLDASPRLIERLTGLTEDETEEEPTFG